MQQILELALNEKSLATTLILILTGIVIFFIRMYLLKQKTDLSNLSSKLSKHRAKYQEKFEKLQSESLELVKLLESFRANDTIKTNEINRIKDSISEIHTSLNSLKSKSALHDKALSVLAKLSKRR